MLLVYLFSQIYLFSSLLTNSFLSQIRRLHRNSLDIDLCYNFAVFLGLRKLLGLMFRQKDQLKKLFYLKVLEEELAELTKVTQIIKNHKVEDFVKKSEYQNNF